MVRLIGSASALVLAHVQRLELQSKLVQKALIESHFEAHAGQGELAGGGHINGIARGGYQVGTGVGGDQLGIHRLARPAHRSDGGADFVDLAATELHLLDSQPDRFDFLVGLGFVEAIQKFGKRRLHFAEQSFIVGGLGIFAMEGKTHDLITVSDGTLGGGGRLFRDCFGRFFGLVSRLLYCLRGRLGVVVLEGVVILGRRAVAGSLRHVRSIFAR